MQMWWFRSRRESIDPYIVISSVLEEPVSDTLIKIVKNRNKWFIIDDTFTIEFDGSICTLAEYMSKKLDKSTIYLLSTNIGIRTKTVVSHTELNNVLLDWSNIIGSIKLMTKNR